MGTTLDFAILGNHILLVHNNVPLSDTDWMANLDAFDAVYARTPPGEACGIVALTEGEAPNAKQRAVADNRPKNIPAAILTFSPVTRSIITALRWMGRTEIEAFKPIEYEKAFAHVKMPRQNYKEALRLLLEMRRKFVGTTKVLTTEELLMVRLDDLRAKYG